MKGSKEWLIVVVTFVVVNMCFAQTTATFDAGQTFSTYKYSDSLGAINDFNSKISGCYALGVQYITNSGAFIKAGTAMRKGGATLSYNGVNVDWTTQYIDGNLGIGYLVDKWRVKPYFAASGYFAYMLKGEQLLGFNRFDIVKDKLMSRHDFGVYLTPGLRVAISNSIAVFAEYKYVLGLQNLELNPGEKSYNRAYSLNLGVAITFIRYKYVSGQ